jgi:hypothetical protein
MNLLNINLFCPGVVENFSKKLSIIDLVALVKSDLELTNLYNMLYQYKDRVFAHHERLLVLIEDTDYYPSLGSVGNSTFNLFEVISALNLSTDHIIILTNCPGVEKEIFYLCDIKNLSYPKVINCMLWYTYPPNIEFVPPATTEKKFLYSCLNGVARTHRKTLMALLYKNKLVDKGMLSYYPDYHTANTKASTSVETDKSLIFRTTVPLSQVNENLSLCRQSKLLQVEYTDQLSIAIKSSTIVGEPNSAESRWQADFLQQSLVYIITETVGDYPYPFITEKTWKSMVSHMPFMIVGARNSLKFLVDCGFKTFSDFWDESYDTKDSVYKRCSIIVDNLKYLNKQDWQELSIQMQPIIKHNFDHLSTFREKELDKIRNIIV